MLENIGLDIRYKEVNNSKISPFFLLFSGSLPNLLILFEKLSQLLDERINSFIFGFLTFPIFSVAAAHANDFAEQENYVDMAASLIFIYGLGSIVSPLFASGLIDLFGPASLFIFLSLVHIALSVIGGIRMMARPSVRVRTPYMYLPRTSLIFGRFLNPSKKNEEN